MSDTDSGKSSIKIHSTHETWPQLHLLILFTRRYFLDLVMVFEIIHRIIDVEHVLFFQYRFPLAVTASRYSAISLVSTTSFGFSTHVVTIWNNLPAACIDSPKVEFFKRELWSPLSANSAKKLIRYLLL